MGLNGHGYTPDLTCRLVTLTGQLRSAEAAATAAATAAHVQISARHLQRLAQEAGNDLAGLRDEQAQQHRRRTLAPQVTAPPVGVVELDGGRVNTREAGVGPGVQQPQPKEDKIACVLSLASDTYATDPQPEPPAAFRDHARVQRLVRDLKSHSVPPAVADAADAAEPATAAVVTLVAADATAAPAVVPAAAAVGLAPAAAPALVPAAALGPPTPATTPAAPAVVRPPPKRLGRTCVASMCCSDDFGPLLAGEAQARGFYDAQRQAFVGDGQQYNWTIQKAYFPHAEAIADFIHLICYLYLAAWAVQPTDDARWAQYDHWLTLCWQGQVAAVSAELAAWQEQLGRPPPEAQRHDPRWLLAEALTYLQNNAARMDYPRYRCLGLPVTSSWAESLVGEFNARVKGWDKHYSRGGGAEAILQVRAAVLSDDGRLERYFAERPGNPYRRHRCAN